MSTAIPEFSPQISIVIPVFNGENYLEEAIESAMAQTYPNYEIIVVNDGSTDMTEKIALGYGDSIQYFRKENGGQSSALNFGIDRMSGEYFSWLSHDDKYYPDKLKRQVDCLSGLDNKDTILYSACTIINARGEFLKSDYVLNNGMIDPGWYILRYNSFNGNSLLINRELFRKFGQFNVRRPHTSDVELIFRFSREVPFQYINEELVYSRAHSKQATSRSFKYHTYESNLFLIDSLNRLTDEELVRISSQDNACSALTDLALNWSRRGYKLAYRAVIERIRYTTSGSKPGLLKLSLKCQLRFTRKRLTTRSRRLFNKMMSHKN
jgi:glycosyltransferase involved in cell wall biosynthesis